MYERFTDRARKVMQLAGHEAQWLNNEYIGTEHVLLALVKEGSGVAANVLKNIGADRPKIRTLIEQAMKAPEAVSVGKLPLTVSVRRAIEAAIMSARTLGDNYVGTEHLLLGLLSFENGACSILRKLNLSADVVREEVELLIGKPSNDDITLEKDTTAYHVHQVGDASNPFILKRILDADTMLSSTSGVKREGVEPVSVAQEQRIAALEKRVDDLEIHWSTACMELDDALQDNSNLQKRIIALETAIGGSGIIPSPTVSDLIATRTCASQAAVKVEKAPEEPAAQTPIEEQAEAPKCTCPSCSMPKDQWIAAGMPSCQGTNT